MIDTKDLREKITIKGLDVVADADILVVLDRLEAAEKELAELRSSMKFRTSLIGRIEAERDALRAKIAEMERQEPIAYMPLVTVAQLESGGSGVVWCPHDRSVSDVPVYALPGALEESE